MEKIALITGSATGLAVTFANELARAGYSLVLNYRHSKEACQRLCDVLTQQYGVRTSAIGADMTSAADIEHMMSQITATYGRLDVLVHSAGPYLFERKRLTEYSDENWNEMIAGNLTSAFLLLRRAIPLMRPQGFGRIITVGFEHVEDAPGWVYRSAYAAAKTGLASLTRTVAQEERENGITANMICPGDIRGGNKEKDLPHDGPWMPLRALVGGDLAALVGFLVSPAAQYVSGNMLAVSGFVDVVHHFDHGKQEVIDKITLNEGARVHILPWGTVGHVIKRVDRHNQRSLYTVQAGHTQAEFTIDHLKEATEDGV
ncbi:MAG: SDR family oxidoreductase [Firmicutes bacterium]|nr:SDR family oxidoreductase [Bacillota bacterium]